MKRGAFGRRRRLAVPLKKRFVARVFVSSDSFPFLAQRDVSRQQSKLECAPKAQRKTTAAEQLTSGPMARSVSLPHSYTCQLLPAEAVTNEVSPLRW